MALQGLLVASLISGLSAAAQVSYPFRQSQPLDKFVQELRGVGPSAIPVAVPDGVRHFHDGTIADHYTIDMNQFTDTLHPQLGPTTLWGYNPRNALGVTGIPTQKHLGGIFVTKRGKPVQITFHNNLPNLHLLPVDHSIMGAAVGQDENRTAIHLHGGIDLLVLGRHPLHRLEPPGLQGDQLHRQPGAAPPRPRPQ